MTKEKINTKEEVRVAIHYLTVCMAILVYGAIYSLAAWGWLLLNWQSNFIAVLSGWAVLFYLFSFVCYPLIKGLDKTLKSK